MAPQKNGDEPRFGRRFEDLSEDERAYYREFFQDPEPPVNAPADPGVDAATVVAARARMATGLSFTLILVSLLLTLMMVIMQVYAAAVLCAIPAALGAGMVYAARRRLFAFFRLPGQDPLPKNKKARWFIVPHLFAATGTACTLASFLLVPRIYSHLDPLYIRSYVIMWAELGLFFLLLAALFYGVFALAVYTPHDDDERLVRPTDYAEKLAEKDIARAQKNRQDGDYYDSSWITGK